MLDRLELASDVTFGTVDLSVDTTSERPRGTIAKVSFDPLMWLDAPTPDGRYFYSSGFATEPLPTFIQYKDRTTVEPGHHDARIAGSLRHVVEDPSTGKVSGWGYLIDNEAGRDALLALETQAIKGVSADLRGCALDDQGTTQLGVRAAYSTSRLAGATICPMPAFPDTVATLDDNFALVASGTLLRDLRPPRDAFDNPRFNRPSGGRVVPLTSEFHHVYGHLALWDTPHVTRKVKPPRDDDFSSFYTGGNVLCDDGSYVPVGRAFIGGDHPDVHLAAQQALDRYTATSLAWADIRVGKDRFGIWYAGVTRPGISEELTYAARASGISGDWRPIRGRLRLIAALSSNTRGFEVYEEGAADENCALIASAGLPPEESELDASSVEPEPEPEELTPAPAELTAARRPSVVRRGLLTPVRIQR